MRNHALFMGLALHIFSFGLLTAVLAADQCYYSTGNPSNSTPCYNDGGFAPCCGETSICLTNGLCLSMEQPYTLSRGGCTDQTWRSSRCSNICVEAQPAAGSAVVWLEGDKENATYCCNSVLVDPITGKKICSKVGTHNGTNFTIPDGLILPGVAVLHDVEKVSNDTSPWVTNATIAHTSATTASNKDSDNVNKEIAIGAGVGVPLAVIALASIGWAFWERRKRKRASFGASQPITPAWSSQNGTYNHNSYDTGELTSSPPKPAELSTNSTR